ncbi:hypothetical protein O3G_MSEX014735 [Manduca sexta]|uniref:Uncharacterized protein n=1 Tax=Manduca sexta TaxID=7130 RepID=A0A922D0S3_MANSE|nr:hypothetical protein O3G_MSEX014735 [Manduca sexta]
MAPTDADNLPPPPAFLLQPDNETANAHQTINVAETVKQLTELKHTPASPGLVRRSVQQLQAAAPPAQPALSTFHAAANKNLQQSKTNFPSSTSINSTGNLNPIYGQAGHRIVSYVENARKNSLNTSNCDLFRDVGAGKIDFEIKKYIV